MNEIELTQELVRINSENPPGNEKQVAYFIHDYLQDLKLEPEIIEFEPNRFNVIAYVGKGNGLALGGHMDTVPIGMIDNWKHDPFGGEVIGKKLYGRGSCDMKSGIACILASLLRINLTNIKRKLVLLFVADEEVDSKGSKWIIENRKEILRDVKAGIMAEPTYNKIRIAQKGIFRTCIKFRGRSAHGARPWLGDNAISKAATFISALDKLNHKLKKDSMLGHGTINIGKISGGTKVNMVPNYCEIEIDRRLVPSETPNTALKEYRKVLRKLGIKAEIEVMGEPRLAMRLPASSVIVKTIGNIVESETVGESGYTESELFYRECGIEFVSFGPGNPKQAHIDDEFVEIGKLRESTYMFKNLLRKWCT